MVDKVWVKTERADGKEWKIIRETEEQDSYLEQRESSVVQRDQTHISWSPRELGAIEQKEKTDSKVSES